MKNSTFAMLAMCLVAASAWSAEVTPRPYYGRIAKRLSDMLPRMHVLQTPLNDEISQRAWTNLVTYYDFDHSVFLKGDLDEFAAHERTIDDELESGNVSFGYDVYRRYTQRLAERIDFATNLLVKGEWDFSTNEVFGIKRKDAPWPATQEEANEYWRKRIKNEMLVKLLNAELDKSTNQVDAVGELVKRYKQYGIMQSELDEEQVLQLYLSALARAFDPHTDYMSPEVKEDFDMDMNLTLAGVGAVLTIDDGAPKIVEIMPGGPVDKDGRIRVGDRIVGVQQDGCEMEDIVWQPLKKSIRKIRGPKGSKVTLEVQPKSDPSGKKLISLVRDKIKLEDQAATGHVERVSIDGGELKLGYVCLPGFYGTMDKRPGDPDYRSCAADVGKYLSEFNAQDVKGLVLDLRGNGGGSLREAVLLSALFVQEGPVVQVRDVHTVGCLPIPRGNPVAFRRPMVVLTDRASASASEIVAGHLQDTERAIVIGDSRTHGKGTVQSVLGMGPEKYGSTKITTARFYRISGKSTQVEGVAADICLPSLLDSLDIGEEKLTYALPFTRILPADYLACWNVRKYLKELRELSAARLKDDERYAKHLDCVKGMKAMSDRTEVPLERAARKAMMTSDRELRELEEDDDEGKEEELLARRKRNQHKKDDVVLDEAYRILADLIRLNGGAELPQVEGWWL